MLEEIYTRSIATIGKDFHSALFIETISCRVKKDIRFTKTLEDVAINVKINIKVTERVS